MAGLSLKSLISQDLNWTLTSLDDGTIVRGQFHPEDMRKDVGSNYASARTVGRAQPIRQFEDENADVITFTARVWAQHEGIPGIIGAVAAAVTGRLDSIEDLVEEIESLPRKIPFLGRPRIWTFSVGSARVLEMNCTVDRIGGMSFAQLRPFSGDLRGVTFRITLTRFEEYDVSLGGTPSLSLVVPVLSNDSYESLSKRVYGNATSGEPLRRRNPDRPSPAVGEMIHMPPQAILTLGYTPTPVSPVLERTVEGEARRREHQAKRAGDYLSYSLGPEWDEVL